MADSVCERKSDLRESDSDESGDDKPPIPYYELLGHPLPCSVAQCGSKLFNIIAASVHYPLLHWFPSHVCRAKKHHHFVFNIENADGRVVSNYS